MVDRPAVQLCAAKVAAVAGDMRKALDICRRAVELVEAEARKEKVKASTGESETSSVLRGCHSSWKFWTDPGKPGTRDLGPKATVIAMHYARWGCGMSVGGFDFSPHLVDGQQGGGGQSKGLVARETTGAPIPLRLFLRQ